MALAVPPIRRLPPGAPDFPPLEPGDHLDRATFHARYEAMPPGIKAELIDGRVYMPSPAKAPHGGGTFQLNTWLGTYQSATPGVGGYDNTTVLLSEMSEPQPDLCLTIHPDKGGQTRISDDWIAGAPELVVEVAATTASYDLYEKKAAYEEAGVREYVVVLVIDRAVKWFVLEDGRYQDLEPGPDGVLRSRVFPGLWLDSSALLQGELAAVLDCLRTGLASPEHADFVARLQTSG